MSADYRNKTIWSPLGTCYNLSELWEIQMCKQLLKQKQNQYSFWSLFQNHLCLVVGKNTTKGLKSACLSTALFKHLKSMRWEHFSAENWFLDKRGIKEVEIGTQAMFSSAARLQMTAWREGLAAGWAVAWWYDNPGFWVSDGRSKMLWLHDKADQRELSVKGEILFKWMFMD